MSTIASVRLSDLIPLAYQSIRHNRLRSLLTIGAVAVGIAVLVYLVSLGFGMEKMTLGAVSQSDALLSVTVRSPGEMLPLDQKALERVRAVDGVRFIYPKLTVSGQLTLEKKNASSTIIGVEPGYLDLSSSTKRVVGTYFRESDRNAMVVTTGFLKLFGLDEAKVPLIPFALSLDPEKYPGVASLDEVVVHGVVDDGAVIAYLPRTFLEEMLTTSAAAAPATTTNASPTPTPGSGNTKIWVPGTVPDYTDLKVKVAAIEDIERVQTELIKHGFRIETVAETITEIKRVFFWIRLVLIFLGCIAIVVASIGMFNTLTISLLERTREIGIMKALGTKRRDILRLFLIEAILMGLIGGVTGIGLAILAQQTTLFALQLLTWFASEGTVPQVFLTHWYILVGAILFALLVALVTGLYPARRAMHLNPIEAIRYE